MTIRTRACTERAVILGGIDMTGSITYRTVPYGDRDFQQTIGLRDRVLRRPWGKTISADDTAIDRQALTMGAFDGERLIGMAMLMPTEDGVARLRFMAVEEAYRGRGVGRALGERLAERARERGDRTIVLYAREHAIPFYEKLGYRVTGTPFLPDHIEIVHVRMERTL